MSSFPSWLRTRPGLALSCALAVGGLFGALLLQWYFPLASVQAAMWSLLGCVLGVSLATTSRLPYRSRNPVVGGVGGIVTLCSFCAFVAFCAGASLPTSDKTAMGLAIVTCLLMTGVSALWVLPPLFPVDASSESEKQLVPAPPHNQSGAGGAGGGTRLATCRYSLPCTVCLTSAWVLYGIIVILFTHDAVGYVMDYQATAPVVPGEWVLQATSLPSNGTAVTEDPDFPPVADASPRLVHMVCNGTGSPLVLLEHGRGGTLWDWAWVQRLVAGDAVNGTRVCSWSRPGYGFSSSGVQPRTAPRIAGELDMLLRSANITEPFIHVGHSFGGLVMRSFQARYPDRVLGQVYVDAMNADCFKPCQRGVTWTRGFGHILAAVIPTGFGRAMSETENLPLDGSALLAMLPEDVRASRRASFISTPFWNAYALEEDQFPTSCAVSGERGGRNLTHIPVVSVIAESGIHRADASDTAFVCGHQLANSVGGDLGRSVVVKGAGHVEVIFDLQYARQVAHEVLNVVGEVRLVRRR